MSNNQLLKLMGVIETQKRLIGQQTLIVENLTGRVLRLEKAMDRLLRNESPSFREQVN